MTKQHFESLAAALKRSRPEAIDRDQPPSLQILQATEIAQWRADVRAVAGVLVAFMPVHKDGYVEARFYAACGYEQEGSKE